MELQRVKTGLASFGMSGMVFHAPLLNSSPFYEITAILERTKENSRKNYPESLLCRSYDELLKVPDIELIIVNTPDPLHFEHARMALEAGKHVVVEKPFALMFEECEELIRLAQGKKLVLTVFHNRRWDSDFLTVQDILTKKVLGRLVSFESHFDRYRNYIQENTWKEDPASGTGIVYNLGSHLIDQAMQLFGHPSSVFAEIRTLRTLGRTDDFFDITLFYEKDISVSLKGSLLVKEPGPRYILHGTDGSFLKWGTDPQEEALKAGLIPGGEGWGHECDENKGILSIKVNESDQRLRIDTLPGNYGIFYDRLYGSIRNGLVPPVNPVDAAMTVKVIQAAFLSHTKGYRVPV